MTCIKSGNKGTAFLYLKEGSLFAYYVILHVYGHLRNLSKIVHEYHKRSGLTNNI